MQAKFDHFEVLVYSFHPHGFIYIGAYSERWPILFNWGRRSSGINDYPD
jgi:hypothetical protein